MQKRFVSFVVVLLVCAGYSPSQTTKQWKAQWIASADAPQRDEVILHFRKVIDLPAAPQHFLVDVSADNQFLFLVNGKRVGTGPSRSDLGHWRYETFDLAPFLRLGKN